MVISNQKIKKVPSDSIAAPAQAKNSLGQPWMRPIICTAFPLVI
jgi:hypothetical protein